MPDPGGVVVPTPNVREAATVADDLAEGVGRWVVQSVAVSWERSLRTGRGSQSGPEGARSVGGCWNAVYRSQEEV